MTNTDLSAVTWHDDGDPEPLARILRFLDEIGIAVAAGPVADSVLPGIAVKGTTIIVDPAATAWPGDLLHEAGHIAVTDPATRDDTHSVADDPAHEMASLAWSYAAAVHLGLDPHIVFHAGGYRGQGATIAANYMGGDIMGAPMLALYGMTAEPHRAAERGIPGFPVMQRWMR